MGYCRLHSAARNFARLGQVQHRRFIRHPMIPDEVYRYVDEGLRIAQQQ